MRVVATTVCLWIAMTTVAISLGGNVFQSIVVDPMWSGSPPDSVRSFAASSLPAAVARFHLNPLYAFGLLCLLASPALAWNIASLRKWLLLAVAFQVVIIVATFLYFHPINRVLLEQTSGVDPTEIVTLTRRWIAVDRVRLALRFATFFCVLRAMTFLAIVR